MKIKKTLTIMIILLLVSILGLIPFVLSENESSKVTIYFFWGDGCPHCETEKPFIEGLHQKYPEIEVKMFETWKNPDNAMLFQKVANAYETTAQGVPTTFIGEKYWVGYADYMGEEIEAKVLECIKESCEDKVKQIVESTNDQLVKPTNDQSVEPISQEILTDKQYTENTQEIEKTSINTNSTITSIVNKDIKELCAHVFLDYSCGECDETKIYFDSLSLDNVSVIIHNVNEGSEKELYESFKEMYGLKVGGYPIVFIGDKYLIGLNAIKNNFENVVYVCKEKDCPCPASKIKGLTPSMPKGDFKSEKTKALDIPFLGKINVGEMPLFLMTALIAFVDGFNPCSLWVLTFLLGIVIYSGSRKKIFLVGLTFLAVTSTAYGLFMLGLLNVFTYIGYTMWIKVGVALIATIFALVNIKDYFWYKKGISFTISDKYKPKMFKKVRSIMDPNKSMSSMLIATALMALGIVLVELPCTAGFPMIWTGIISEHNVSKMMYALLFGLYMLIYLIDELVVFTGVTLTLKASKFEEKHGRILKLIGGMIMLALAFALIFLPDAMNSVSGSLYVFGSAVLLSYLVLLIHRKILPKYGITIGTEAIDSKTLESKEKDDDKKNNVDSDDKKKKTN